MKKSLLVFTFCFVIFTAFSQNRTSSQSGYWDQTSTWGGQTVPDNTFGTFGNVLINHNVVVRASSYNENNPLRIDNLYVGASGSLVIENGAALLLQNGTSIDLSIFSGGSFVNNGIWILDKSVSFSGLTVSNTSFTSGSELRTSSLSLPTAGGYALTKVTLQGQTTTANLNSTWSQLTSGTDLIIDCPSLGNYAVNFGGFITSLNSLQIINSDGDNGGYVIINPSGTSTLNIGSGGFLISGDSRFFLTSSGNVTVNASGNVNYSPNSSALFSALTNSGTGTINLSGGNFIMTDGDFRFVNSGSNGSNGNLRFLDGNMVISGGVFSERGSGTASGLIEFLNTSSNQTMDVVAAAYGVGTINVSVDKGTTQLLLEKVLQTTDLNLISGSVYSNNNSTEIIISGNLTSSSGLIDATTNNTSLSVKGTGSVTSPISFVTGSVLYNLSINRTGASLNLGNASLADGGTIEISAGGLATEVNALGVYNLTYSNSSPLTMGVEVPTAATTLENLTIAGTSSVMASKNLSINGSLSIQSGSFLPSTYNINLVGDLIVNQNLVLSNSSTLTFEPRSPTNTHNISGNASLLSVGALTVNGDLTVNRNLTLNGNLTINSSSSFVANSGTILISSPVGAINNGNALTFNHLNVTSTFTAPVGTMTVNGDFSGSGTFNANSGTVVFGGTTTISGSVKGLNNIYINNGATVSASINLTVAAGIINNGSLTLSGTLTKTSNGTLSGTGTSTFNVISVGNGATFTANSPITISGNINGGGGFTSTSEIVFSGTTNLLGGAKTFNRVTILEGSSLSSTLNFTIAENIINNGTLNLSAGKLTKTTGTISGTGVSSFYVVDISSGNTFTATVPITITGNIGGLGNFTSTSTVTFNGVTYLAGAGAKTFQNIIVNGSSLTPNASYSIAGNMTVNATLNSGKSTVTFSGNSVINGSGNISFNNITVKSGNTLSFSASSINVSGNFINNGSFEPGSGTVSFTSDGTTKLIGGTSSITFNNVSVANTSSSIDLQNSNSSGVFLKGLLTLAPAAVFDADGSLNNLKFTVISNALGDGAIGPLTSGAAVSGKISVQRYLNAIDDDYRYISSPVQNSPISDLQASGIPITGGFQGTSYPCTGCNNDFYNLFWNDETKPGYIPNGATAMPSSGLDNSEILVPGRGYELYMWNGVSPVTWTASGSINSGDINLNVSRTLSGDPVAFANEDGWNLIGNPYPSAITWEDNVDLPGAWSISSNIYPVVYVWDVTTATWLDYDYETNLGSLANGKISMGQAFWVFVTNTDPASLVLHESAKSGTNGTYYRQALKQPEGLIVSLKKETTNGQTIEDKAYLYSSELGRDIPKLYIGREALSVSLLIEGQKRLVSKINEATEEIPLFVSVKDGGRITLELKSSGELEDAYFLNDHLRNQSVAVNEKIELSLNNGELSTLKERFTISKTRIYGDETDILFSVYPNPSSGHILIHQNTKTSSKVAILNQLGAKVKEISLIEGLNEADLDTLPKGVYFIKLETEKGNISIKRLVLK